MISPKEPIEQYDLVFNLNGESFLKKLMLFLLQLMDKVMVMYYAYKFLDLQLKQFRVSI